MQAVKFKAGDTIIREGEEGDAAFFVVSGSVEVFIGRGAAERGVGALKAGEVFGEMCLIDPGPRSATVRAATDAECLAMSYEEFVAAIEDHPDRAVVFMKTLVRRLRQMNALMEGMSADKHGLRDIFRECQKSLGPAQFSPEVNDLSWTMLW
jgi:CRP-like cAMP-binding protein